MRFQRTPTVIQMEATECGAAALGSILAHYGCYLPLEELRIACGVSRDGSKAVNMLNAARKYGLEAKGAKADLAALRDVQPPFIIFWEFNHFIVIDGIHKDKVYINDPATGPRTISWDALDKGFTGVLLVFEPTEKLKKIPKPPLIRESLTQIITVNNQAMTIIILASFFLIIPGIIIPGFNKIFIDNILIQNMQGWFYPLMLGMLMATLLQGLLMWVQQRILLLLKMKIILSAGANVVWQVLHLPMQFFYQRYAGDIGDRVNANDRIANLLTNDLSASVVGILAMIFFGIILLLINYKLALVGLVVILINLSIFRAVLRKIEDTSRDYLQQYGRLTGMEMSSVQMIETIKGSGIEDDFFKRWSARHAYIIGLEQSIAFYNQIIALLPQCVYGLGNVVILALGSWFIMQGEMTVGGLIAFQSLLLQWNLPLNTLIKLGSNIQQIRGDLLRINDILHYTPETTGKIREAFHTQDQAVSVHISNLVFGYSSLAPPLFYDFDLDIPAKQRLALIGKTGSDKSTLAKLIMHLYKPWQGKVCLNATELEKISAESLAQSIAMVEQDIFLFEGSVRENLSLWDPSVPDEHMNQALQVAELEEELAARGGLNCMLIEGGFNLSGGQRQRLEIARALVKNPKLLVLDEATSSLDPSLEKKIFDNLLALDLTLIIITHRISAIRDCDTIVLMENGKIIHSGSHEQLITIALYKQLVDLEELKA